MKTEAEIRETARELSAIIEVTRVKAPHRVDEMMALAFTAATLRWVIGENPELDKLLDRVRGFLVANGGP